MGEIEVSDGIADTFGEQFQFGSYELQRLTVFNPLQNNLHQDEGLWIIYIHGGAWRDPTITDGSFLPSIKCLLSHPLKSQIHLTAFASLSYRLSAHPDHPQDLNTTPVNEQRTAKHPDHLDDVLAGLAFLQEKYAFGKRYVLVGHSCGATLALQAILRTKLLRTSQVPIPKFVNPLVVIGVAGIYDLRLLRDTNSHPAYQSFLEGAFGSDESVWDEVSPARFEGFGNAWKENARMLVCVSSSGDELVDESQIDAMERTLKDEEMNGMRVEIWKQWLHVPHDEIWETGKGLGDVIERALEVYVENCKT